MSAEATLIVDDEERTFLVGKFPIGLHSSNHSPVICTVLFDITATRDLEAQLRQSQKMEAIGLLAGGVAHDFNNLLTGIIGYADLALMNSENDTELSYFLDQILETANRAAELTGDLLAFSRKQVIYLHPVDLNLTLEKMEHLLIRVIGEDIQLTATPYQDEPVIVLADSHQIEQIIINLATNSRDAMPEGGSLDISTSRTTISINDKSVLNLLPGEYGLLICSDTGSGIPSTVANQIFEPFFTTKDVGKGTGLGLSIVYGIVKQHHGEIQIETSPTLGTTFKIYLPLIEGKPDAPVVTADLHEIHGNGETILVVEDEQTVRNLFEQYLISAGYSVLTAEDGQAGLEVFQLQQENIDLVLLDVVMPKMNGHKAYKAMQEIMPDLKALFISGYTADIIDQHASVDFEDNLLRKPIRREALLLKIKTTLKLA